MDKIVMSHNLHPISQSDMSLYWNGLHITLFFACIARYTASSHAYHVKGKFECLLNESSWLLMLSLLV